MILPEQSMLFRTHYKSSWLVTRRCAASSAGTRKGGQWCKTERLVVEKRNALRSAILILPKEKDEKLSKHCLLSQR